MIEFIKRILNKKKIKEEERKAHEKEIAQWLEIWAN